MTDFTIEFPEYFDDEAPIIEAKGWFGELTIVIGERRLRPTFYDPVRFAQECRDDLEGEYGYFAVGALIVVPSVTRQNIEYAVERLSRANFRDLLDPLEEL